MPRLPVALPALLLYLMALAIPLSVSGGTITVVLGLLLAAGLALKERGAASWPPRPVLLALAGLLLTYALATALAGPFPRNWHKLLEESWIKLLLVAIPLLAGRHPRHAAHAARLALGVAVLVAVYAIWQHFSGLDPIRGRSIYNSEWGHGTVTGMFSHHLSFGGQLLIFIVLAASWLFAGKPGRWRGPLVAALGLFGLAMLWSFARSCLLGAGVGLFVVVLLLPGKLWPRLLALGLAACGALALPTVGSHLLRNFGMDENYTRLNLWRSSLDGIVARPFLGFGPGNFEYMLARHEVEGFYKARGHAHNDLLMHGVNAGLLGLLAAVALLAITAWLLYRGWRRGGQDAWLLLAGVGIQAGITVAGIFQVFQTDDEVEMLLYFLIGCGLAVLNRAGHGQESHGHTFDHISDPTLDHEH